MSLEALERRIVMTGEPTVAVGMLPVVFQPQTLVFGEPSWGDVPVSADYDGDGIIDPAVYRPSGSRWFILGSRDGYRTEAFGQSYGSHLIPVPADYDGDGKADLAVFETTTAQWAIEQSQSGAIRAVLFGQGSLYGGDPIPVPADYDGDGWADIAVFQPSTSTFSLSRSTLGGASVQFGQGSLYGGDPIPVPADYDGDGWADIAVFQKATASWSLQWSGGGAGVKTFGAVSDIPVPADRDGDGRADLATYRPGNARWPIERSTGPLTWAIESGGSPAGRGGTSVESGGLRLGEGDSSMAAWEGKLVIPSDPSVLTFSYADPVFDDTATVAIRDALEVALVDDGGRPLVPTIMAGRDAFLNITAGHEPILADGVSLDGTATRRTATLDISRLTPGRTARLIVRMVNDDSDTGSSALLLDGSRWIYQVPGNPGEQVDLTFARTGDTNYTNEFGISVVDDLAGRVGNLLPGDVGYGGAALSGAQVIFARSATDSSVTVRLAAGTLITPYLVQNGTTADFLDPPAGRPAPSVWFGFTAANSDGFAHLKRWDQTNGRAQFAFEDLTSGGDRDFDDLVATITAASPVNPGTRTPTAAWAAHRAIDFAHLADVTPSFAVDYGTTSLRGDADVLHADLVARNIGRDSIGGPLLVGIDHVRQLDGTPAPSVRVRDTDGVTPDGIPYYDLSGQIGGATLDPDEATAPRTLAFHNPDGLRFTYDLIFLASRNRAPSFTTTPLMEIGVGSTYAYDAGAVDPDGDALTFTIPIGPAGMVQDPGAPGRFTWTPTAADVGMHDIMFLVDDGRGGTDVQRYPLTVTSGSTNRPPYFTSDPVVDAGVATPYSYLATAADPDFDALTFTKVAGPANLDVDPATGLVTWLPTADQLGPNPVTLQISDGHGGLATQAFTIVVRTTPDNHPPVIISEPITSLAAPLSEFHPGSSNDEVFTVLGVRGQEVLTTFRMSEFDTNYSNEFGLYHVLDAEGHVPRPAIPELFDFGTATSPVAAGYTRVTNASAYWPARGYGWLTDEMYYDWGYDVDRGEGAGNDLTRDLHLTELHTFVVDVADGTYDVTLTLGDPGYDAHDQMGIYLEGTLFGSVDTAAGEVVTRTYRVQVADGQLTLRLQDLGGYDYNIALAALEVHAVPGTVTTPLPDVLAPSDPGYAEVALAPSNAQVIFAQGTRAGDTTTVRFLAGEFVAFFLIQNAAYSPPNESGWMPTAFFSFSEANPDDGQSTPGVKFDHLRAVVKADEGLTEFGWEDQTGGGDQDFNDCVYTIDQVLIKGAAGPIYTYQVVAIDSDNDALTYSMPIAPVGAQINAKTGLISWAATPGTHDFTVRVDDGHGFDTPGQAQSFTLTVDNLQTGEIHGVAFSDQDANGARSASEPGLVGQTVFLDLNQNGQIDAGEPTTITDQDGRYAFTGLASGTYTVAEVPPAGWLTTTPLGGTYQVTITGGQYFIGRDFGNQDPRDINHDPTFQTTAPTQAAIGQLLRYDAAATDPDGDRLIYDLPVHPAGMGIDYASGTIIWVPPPGQEGSHSALLRVRDGRGGVALQPIRIEIGPPNQAPQFTGPPGMRTVAGRTYTSQAQAVDPDGDSLTYRVVSGPSGLDFHDPSHPGLLTWTAAPEGTYTGIVIEADDGRGGLARLTFPLQVIADTGNHDPAITSDYRRTIQLDRTYLYQVVATDDDNDPLLYGLVGQPAGMVIDPATGLVSWTPVVTPTENPFGSHTFHVLADDGRGAPADQEVTVRVVAQATNGDPTITATLPPSAIVGQPYSPRLTGSDPDNDPLFWGLATAPDGSPDAPAGMVIDPSLGTVAWMPTTDQLGPQSVTVRLDDGQGGWTTRTFAITVRAANRPPRIGPLTPPEAGLGVLYSYQVVATDPEDDTLDFELIGSHPGDMTIDDAGLLQWLSPGPLGSRQVSVQVTDTAGNVATATFAIVVASSVPNQPPRFTSEPIHGAVVGEEYQYAVTAVDDDGNNPLDYDVQGAPSGMTIDHATGLIRWTPSAATSARITVVVTDALGAWRAQGFTITARADNPPTLEPIPDATVARGAPFRHDARASDPDADDALHYGFNGPSWLSIDTAGRITGTPDASVALGPYSVQVTAIDSFGKTSSTRSFTLTVTADATAPTVQVYIVNDDNSVNMGRPATIQVTAQDDVGVASLSLTVGGKPVRLDRHGVATVTLDAATDYAVVATAVDAAGNTATSTATTLHVIDPSVTSRPAATILSPVDSLVTVVTVPTPVHFTATDTNLASYTLAYAPLDSDDWTTLDTGTASVTDRVVTFDPTLLTNGAYTLRLTARNTGGVATVDERILSVEGNLKLGNLKMSFNDLTIPVAGIPITITRIYDSLDARMDGDFGFGWTLEESNFKVRVSQSDGVLRAADLHQPFRADTRVVITRPGHEDEVFVFLPQSSGFFASPYLYKPHFEAVSGTSRLTVSNIDLIKEGDDYFAIDFTPYNPADSVANPSRAYTLTTRDGSVYVFDAATGRIATITDRVGRELYFDDNGIHADDGRGVAFVRDPRTNRIQKIIDERSGREITYGYDAAGDLKTVTTPFDGAQTSTTEFVYDSSRPHFLKEVIDPLGRTAATTHYDAEGRIERVVDADGKQTLYQWDADTLAQHVTDQLGYTTELTLDDRGNVLRVVDPEGGITKRAYDGDNHLLSETIVVGLEDPAGGESDDLTTTYTYVDGNLATVTDPRGNLTFHTYNTFGQPTGVGTADGGTSSGYDPFGLLRWTQDLNGNRTNFDYDPRGNLTAVRDQDDHTLITSTYNVYGELTSTTPAAGRTTFLDYAASGEVVGRWSFDGEGANQVQVLDVTRYNDAGQVVETVHAVLPVGEFLTGGLESATIPPPYIQWTTATTYNPAGQVLTQTDQLGRVTEHAYGKRGQEIQVRSQSADEQGNPVWLVTRTVYDDAGRVVAATDPYVEGTPAAEITGTRTEYDKVGRVTRTERRQGLRIDLNGSGAFQRAVIGDLGTLVAASETTYDTAGRVTSSTDADGLQTHYTYNRFGETVETRTQSYDQDDQLVWLVTRTVYDDRGRAVLTTDSYVEGSAEPVQGSETLYDDQGRAHRSIRRTGVQVDLDPSTHATTLANAGSELWRTETVFDAKGRVGRTIAADGQATDYEYDHLGRRVAVIGPAVEIGGQTVRHRTETVHDDQGRVGKERTGIRQHADGSRDDSDVRETTYAYDAAGNLVQTTFADGTTIAAAHDDLGRKISETNQLGLTRTFEYDAAGRLAAVELPAVADPSQGGAPTRPRYEYGYDAQGNQTLIRDPLGRETRFTYDAQGRQLTRTLPLGFGPDGKLGTADDGNLPEGGFSERFEYDDRGRQTLHVSFEGVVTQFLYDPHTGRLSQQRFFASEAAYNHGAGTPAETCSYTYDALGRVVQVVQAAGSVSRSTTTDYDPEGRVSRIDAPEGAVNYRYDDLGRRVRTFTGAESNPLEDTHYAYDGLGRLQSVTVVARDGLTLTSPEVTTHAYDLLGNLAREDRPDGTIVTYRYDNLDRLTELTQYAPDSTPEDLSDNPRLAEFAYDLRDDGRRQRATETFWFDAAAHTSTTTWTYDDLGRLVDEVIDHYDGLLDQTERFTYDLTGNRLRQILDRGSDGTATPDEITVYAYDANDRLKTEALDATGDGLPERTTTYDYDHTQQTGKTVTEAGAPISHASFAYDLQGRMAVVTTTTYAGGVADQVERMTYGYGPDGIRASALHEVDADADGIYETATKVEYLNDPDNPTGYSQVLKETTSDLATNQVQKTIVYTIGHDIVSQTTTEYAGGLPGAPETLVLGRDGHGSTRLLTDLAGAIATFMGARQVLDYTAYGNLLNLEAGQAATSLLYSGEMFDAKIGLQYLRGRWYNPASGRFNRLDPFFGNLQDPQSLHKYLYTHGDPVNGIDPTGRSQLLSVTISIGIGSAVGGISGGFTGGLRGALQGIVFGGLAGGIGFATFGIFGGLAPEVSTLAFYGAAFGSGVVTGGSVSGLQSWWNGADAEDIFYDIIEGGILGGAFGLGTGLLSRAIVAAWLRVYRAPTEDLRVPLRGSKADYEEFVQPNKGILAHLDDNNFIEFKINTEGSGVRGTEVFNRMMRHFGDNVKGIWGKWVSGTNLDAVNKLTSQGVPLEEAVSKAWTANRARSFGFDKVTIVKADGSPGAYKNIEVKFKK